MKLLFYSSLSIPTSSSIFSNFLPSSLTVTLGLVIGYVIAVDQNNAQSSDSVLIFAVLVGVGMCTSLTYGAFAQIVALVPDRYHYYFFMGTMCPFFIYIPLNVATGVCLYSLLHSNWLNWFSLSTDMDEV